MPTWLIIVLAVLVLLAVGGAIAARRRLAATSDRFDANLQQVNRDLALAHAEDRGWERSALEAAARQAYAAERGGAEPSDLELTQVIDRPGTDEDKAVFRCGAERLTLGRRDGEWVLEALD
jgi:Tfp pilus assembly protein PilX